MRRLRIAGLALLVAIGGAAANGKEVAVPQPVATLDTAEFLPNQTDLSFTTVAFSSDTTIEVVACRTFRRDRSSCPFSVFSWQNGVLEHTAQVPHFKTGDNASSTDGARVLLDYNNRKASKRQRILDDMRAVWTFGMIYPESVNREVVQVVDTTTRNLCFDWHQIFPMTGIRRRSAAISPAGEFVAIKVGNALSVYRLPKVCEGRKVIRKR
jgi:hypothetical protein